jgi:uncharacterized GH25 family protein
MQSVKSLMVALATLSVFAPVSAMAHDQWILPSATQVEVSQNAQRPTYVTFDAASSNQLFEFNHNPLRVDNLVITGPDGATLTAENVTTGKLRSSFDLKIDQTGTYRIAVVTDTVTAAWTENGETKTFQGTPAAFATDVPEGVSDLAVARQQGRIETYVTSGAPTDVALSNQGLEIVPLVPVTDLVAGEAVTFRLLLDGQPVAGVEVKVVPGGARFRSALGDKVYTTNDKGEFEVEFDQGGIFWFGATHTETAQGPAPATASALKAANGRTLAPGHRRSYQGTFEVAAF